mmetsp:Transcript_13412/g.37005  ORF Transcript_13412/g.37005 Transcript_13412/m.37005 type:complete len:211 (+) Transcript_13412:502-1134(+)
MMSLDYDSFMEFFHTYRKALITNQPVSIDFIPAAGAMSNTAKLHDAETARSRWEFPPTRRKRTVSFAADTDASKVTGRTQMRSSSRGSAAGSATPPQTPTRPPLPPGRNNPGDGHDTGPNSPGESPNPPHPATNADGGGGGGNPLIYHVTYPQSSEASNFDKGGRRSSSDYEKFSNKEHWHKWQRSTLGQAYEHKSENILDVTFIPVGGT